MKLYEYQGKELFRNSGIPTPRGHVIRNLAELDSLLPSLSFPVVVKAQVLVGGRGKAGGIKTAASAGELQEYAKNLLGSFLKEDKVIALLIEEKVAALEEYYLGVTLDRATRQPLILFSRKGGMDIEEVAKETPEAIARIHVDPQMGLRNFHLEQLVKAGGVTDPDVKKGVQQVAQALYRLWDTSDAALVEINPLMVLADKTVVAADAKVDIDDSALFRHPELEAFRRELPESELERAARETGFLYIDIDPEGNVGVISNGSGMIMSCIDWIARHGGKVTCALDLGGGATADRVARGIGIVLRNPKVKSLLISIFGGITRCDEIAGGIVRAVTEKDVNIPIVARLEGTNKEKGLALLAEVSGKTIEIAATLPEAADKVLRVQGR
ncbi:MAG: succinyl-CoA synthetase beta subunit [Bacillota bacterium]|jgi:succinyl-CoA synthetase beta subunit|nr:succinyl-CoA synthetase beta subunit [Bacillota bacterium]MDK2855259.1 succinyl-CoA synthetase beta subunit [Bacillota bacterium]